MEEEEETVGLSKPVAALACTAMAVFYVAVLYAPAVILRLPPPSSFQRFLIRRFLCAAISSVASIFLCSLILPVKSKDASSLLALFGLRFDHVWQALVFPFALTSLMYSGSLALKLLLFLSLLNERISVGGGIPFSIDCFKNAMHNWLASVHSIASNVAALRNYVVAPLTEELVFRACMIPVLLCGGFKIYSVIFLCPILFSLAHLNHWMEIYSRHNYSLLKASMVIGLQLGYTVIFGSYASFLYIRTGHFLAPFVAHVFCNFMGLPVMFARRKGVVSVAFVAGVIAFVRFLLPLTAPDLYNDRINNCECWHGYCSWSSKHN